jgi:cytidine deaminase
MKKYRQFFCCLMFLCVYTLPAIFTGSALAADYISSYNPRALRIVYGFDREFPPFSYEDPGGKPVGFEIDIIDSIFRGKATLVLRPLNWYSLPIELTAGSITLTTGMIKTPQRAKTYGFSDLPIFDMKIRFFTKVYKRVPTPDFLRGQMVSVEEGSFQQNLLENFGGINIKTFKTRTLALRALYNDEVDAYCGQDEPSYYVIRKLNYGGITTLGAPLGVAEMRIAVNRDRGDVLRMVNEGLQELVASGEYDRLYRKWFTTELDGQEAKAMVDAAKKATISSYAPYGRVNHGAAILTVTGKVFAGCNVENKNEVLGLSAVRAALARCVFENELELRAVVLLDQNGKVLTPGQEDLRCLLEFGRGLLVIVPDAGGTMVTKLLAELLPNPVTGKVE